MRFGRRVCLGLALVVVAFVAYLPVLRAGFVWDDDSFLTKNPLITGPDGLRRIWLTGEGADYWPLTSTFMWVQWRLWGGHALGYHVTNLGLHLVEVLLLWKVLVRLRVPGAWLAALLYAVHPVNVESVAWITQAKNLMAMLASLLAVLCYLESSYWLSAGCFALAMLGKSSAVMLPLILLGITAWHRRLTPWDLLRMIPFAFIGAILAGISKVREYRSEAGVLGPRGLAERLVEAGAAVWFYLQKAVAPVHLSFVYPRREIRPTTVAGWGPLLAVFGLTWILWVCRNRGGKPLLAVWGYFVIALLPALGLVNFYFLRYSPVADHYAQFALIGIAVIAAWGEERWRGAVSGRIAAPAVAGLIVVLFSAMTWRQARSFADAEQLYRSTLRENPSCWLAYNNLGVLAGAGGREGEALDDFRRAVAAGPDVAETHFNLGAAMEKAGQTAPAAGEFEAALRVQPSYRPARLPLAEILSDAGWGREAALQYRLALELPATAGSHRELADYFRKEGRDAAAEAEYREALRLEAAGR